MKDKITNFYDSFRHRIRFIRQSKGLTLAELSSGSPSTAQSWESGTYPRTNRWKEIAEKLKVSEPFLFRGIPTDQSDYDFIRENNKQIGPPPLGWKEPRSKDNVKTLVCSSQEKSLDNALTVSNYMQPWFDAMEKNPNIAPYVMGILIKYLPTEDLNKLNTLCNTSPTVNTRRNTKPMVPDRLSKNHCVITYC